MPTKLEIDNIPNDSLQKLANNALFSGMTPQDSRMAIDGSDLWRFEGGELVFNEGSASDGLFVIIAGGGEVFTKDDQKINRLTSGDIVGELGLLCRVLRTATIKAGPSGAVMLQVRQKNLDKLLDTNSRLYATIMKNVSVYLANMIIEITNNK